MKFIIIFLFLVVACHASDENRNYLITVKKSDNFPVNSIIFEQENESKPALLEMSHTTIEIDPTLNDHILEVTQYKKKEIYKNSCLVKCVEQSSKCSVDAILPLRFKYKFIIKDRNDNLKIMTDPIIFEGQLIEIEY